MDNSSASSITPIPTSLMYDYRRRRALLDWLDMALDASERGDFIRADCAVTEAGALIAEMEARS